jgi:CYTH domain-containing protein
VTDQTGGALAFARHRRKYALVERERRFLLASPPEAAPGTEARKIVDRYIVATRLRLRRVEPGSGPPELKLTQKVPAGQPGPVQELISTIYLSQTEYDVLAALPADVLSKTRYSVPPLGIDVFDAPRQGLVLAEAEFPDDDALAAFEPPAGIVAEVTADARFTGGQLARAQRGDLLSWLADYGIKPAAGDRAP